jgi:hypothetical protein
LLDNVQKIGIDADHTATAGEAETETIVEEMIDMTEVTGMIGFNSEENATETKKLVTEIEAIVEIVMTGIVIMKGIVIETKSEEIVQDLTLVPGPLLKAITDETNAKKKKTREDVQEADFDW